MVRRGERTSIVPQHGASKDLGKGLWLKILKTSICRSNPMRYRVQFTPDDNDTLLVTCPDIPEVATFGADEADARVRAADAIVTALQGRITARRNIPEPTEGGDGEWIEIGALVEAKLALYQAMRADGLTKADLGRRLQQRGPSIDRLLDLGHDSRFQSIEGAFKALGREMRIDVRQAA